VVSRNHHPVWSFFFLAGTVGLLRFPDTYSRIHALTKADNLGLGFTVVGVMLLGADLSGAIKLLFVWLFALVSSSTACYLIASSALSERRNHQP
jgi:multicomponent Na+:H+ antiporter subunit G